MRLKIIAGNLVAVLLLGLLSYTIIRGRVESEVVSDIDKHIRDDQTLFDRSWRLSAIEFLENVRDRAGTTAMRDVFAGLDVTSRRTRAFEAAEVVARWFADPARGRGGAPDLVVITDETGRVIARNADRNRMFDAQLSDALPALRTALQGNAVHDVWRFVADGKVLQTGIAPIRNDRGTLLGALVVGYDISNGVARSEAQVLGRDVAFLTSDKVYSSSLPGPAAEALKAYLFGAARAQTMAALGANRTPSQTWVTKLGDSEYVGVTAPLPHSTTENAGYVVLANRTEALQTASAVNVILLLTLLFAVAVVGYGMVIGTSFLRPIEQIEEGVLAVINGRTDLRLDIESTELGGLAYRINQLLNVFTGVTEGEQEEDDEGRVSRPPQPDAWRDAEFADSTTTGGAAAAAAVAATPIGGGTDVIDDAEIAGSLAAEPEDAYYARVHREYVAAKEALGENVSNIPQERFVQRLKGNESALVQKHGCRMVRFQVQTRGNQVILRPVLIR